MSDKKTPIKEDINFLEYPNWLVSERSDFKTLTIEKENGRYVISTTDNIDRLPDRTDKIVLYYLLHVILPTKKNKLITSRYNILKNAFDNTSKQYYERIIDSLNRWLSITILFDGVFYGDNEYTARGFHILDGYKLNNDGKLEIYFDEQYLEQLRKTDYFKLINFNEYKRLKKPVAARSYEILIKTFKDRYTWKIDIIKLAEKLTLSKRYPSQVLEKLIPAVNEINRQTELNVKLDYNKKTRICTFTKVKQAQLMESEDKPEETSFPEDTN